MSSVSVQNEVFGHVVHQARVLDAAPDNVATIKDTAKIIHAVIAIRRGLSAIIFSQIHLEHICCISICCIPTDLFSFRDRQGLCYF